MNWFDSIPSWLNPQVLLVDVRGARRVAVHSEDVSNELTGKLATSRAFQTRFMSYEIGQFAYAVDLVSFCALAVFQQFLRKTL